MPKKNSKSNSPKPRRPYIERLYRRRGVEAWLVDGSQPERVHSLLLKKLNNGVTVWLVDGRRVRSAFDIGFTEGGHEHVYEYVPRNELWIDDDVHDDERGFILLHELFERRLMSEGVTYDDAHEQASKREGYLRHHPAELHEALADEGWE